MLMLSRKLLVALLCCSPALVSGQNTANALVACLKKANVAVTIASDADWGTATLHLQLRKPAAPVAVARPKTRDEVVAALKCGRENGVKVSIVNRAHSFQNWGFGNPGNLVINISELTSLSFDAATNELTYAGGANIGPTAKYLWDNHKRHFPHVRGSYVGMVGSTMGGGFSSTGRWFGLPCDNLVRVEYLLSNGTIVTAGPGSDLLWAAQGAGASFGVILSATTKTYEIPLDSVVQYSISLGGQQNTSIGAQVLLAIQDFAINGKVPDEFSLRFPLDTFISEGYFYGEEKTFDALFAPLITNLRAIVPGLKVIKKVLPSFWASEVAISGPGMDDRSGGIMDRRASLVQSWAIPRSQPFTSEQANILLAQFAKVPRPDLTSYGFVDLWGGVDRDISDENTAYPHSGMLWLARMDGVGVNFKWPTDGVAYLQGLAKPIETALLKSGPLRSFPNYVDSEHSVQEWSSRLYGENYGKLQRLKAVYDPQGVFSGYGLAIPPAAIKHF